MTTESPATTAPPSRSHETPRLPGPLALTMGEPAGIGGEIALKAWLSVRGSGMPFFVIDDPERLDSLARDLRLAVPIAEIATPRQATNARFAEALPVLPLKLANAVTPGKLDAANGPAVIESIRRAVAFAMAGEVAAVVTNPIHKKVLYDVGFRHPGHTEFLTELTGSATPSIMMLASADLRVVPVTIHQSVRQAIDSLRGEAIIHCARVTADALKTDFGIARPRLAISGLNPHAGEGGAMGREEIDIIAPAIAELRAAGLTVVGPLPADTMFHAQARAAYDAAICMYHDQALIPLKTLAFEQGVDVTLGLPIVRTSPDHGTALDIAGSGRANPASLIAAIQMAADIARRRATQGLSRAPQTVL
jgi:4-hydroxythreonine-4-phosphate dehydrogenase